MLSFNQPFSNLLALVNGIGECINDNMCDNVRQFIFYASQNVVSLFGNKAK